MAKTGGITGIASFLPAWCAVCINPAEILKAE